MSGGLGLYLHVPYCARKCPYCDFYSTADRRTLPEYPAALASELARLSRVWPRQADTLYLGGGTPTLLPPEAVAMLVRTAREHFDLPEDAEVTIEANPVGPGADEAYLRAVRAAGVGRISYGLQAAGQRELTALGRGHTAEGAAQAVRAAQRAGFENISLDLMLGIPYQTRESLLESVELCARLGVQHVSAYLLKIEPGTAFARDDVGALCPDEDEQAELYLTAVEALGREGYRRYEIANFARPGFEGRHNLKYWKLEDYLGIGPGAHSCVGGRRFYCPRDLRAFLQGAGAGGAPVCDDGPCGSADEYVMLRLRLREGVPLADYAARYGGEAARALCARAERVPARLLTRTDEALRLTDEGALVSNAVIVALTG